MLGVLASRRLGGIGLHFALPAQLLRARQRSQFPPNRLQLGWTGAHRLSAEHLASCSTPGSSCLGVLPLCVGMERQGERTSTHHHSPPPPPQHPNEVPSWELCKYFRPLPRPRRWTPFRPRTFLINRRGVRRRGRGSQGVGLWRLDGSGGVV